MNGTIYGKGPSDDWDPEMGEGYEDSADSKQAREAQETMDEIVETPRDPESDYDWSSWDSWDSGDSKHENATEKIISQATSQVVSRVRSAGRAVDSKLDDAGEKIIDGLGKIDEILGGDGDE